MYKQQTHTFQGLIFFSSSIARYTEAQLPVFEGGGGVCQISFIKIILLGNICNLCFSFYKLIIRTIGIL